MYNCKIIADSLSPHAERLITFVATYPRIIHSDVMTHRVFARNSASSRAIPFKKMRKMVLDTPFIPFAWQTAHTGMQGSEYHTGNIIKLLQFLWIGASYAAVFFATLLNLLKVTKQLANRLLEPFMWHTVAITTHIDGLENFFKLRCPQYNLEGTLHKSWKEVVKEAIQNSSFGKYDIAALKAMPLIGKLKRNRSQADIHIQELAERMYNAYKKSTPKQLLPGEWHIPNEEEIEQTFNLYQRLDKKLIPDIVKVSTMQMARISYTTLEDMQTWTVEKYIEKHDLLKSADPFHASPFEHCAKAMSDKDLDNYMLIENGIVYPGRCRNFTGFIQYRVLVEHKLIS